MLVIHPKDRTTAMLSALYNQVPEARMLDCTLSVRAIERELHHLPKSERIMLLGHGSDKGLYWREDDTSPGFDKIVIGNSHAFHLRNHGSNIIAIFCNADSYAKSHGLHGLFTGMIISEMSEAAEYGIETTQEELDCENVKFAQHLRFLLDEKVYLSDIPQRMLALDDKHTPLTDFNYRNIFYR